MRSFREISEAPGDTAVFTFGRFNPPTTGHEKLIDALARESKKVSGSKMYVFASHSQDPKSNPLPYPKKIAYMKKMFPKYRSNITTAKERNIFDVATFLYDKGHKSVVMVVGSDRVAEFTRLLNEYNDVKGRHGFYKFDTIRVVSAGERDPDAEGVEGMSASKMRDAAAEGEFDQFIQGLPSSFKDSKKLFRDVLAGMGIREERNMGEMTDYEELRDAYLTNKIWKIDDLVEANGIEGRVVRRGTNYISYMDGSGKVHKAWLKDIALNERNYRKEYDNYHSRPDQIAKRSSRNKARRAMGDKVVKGKDVGHKDNNPLNNAQDNLRNEDPSKNRREPRLREDTLDEMSWFKKAQAKIDQMRHPKNYKAMVSDYVDLMKTDKTKMGTKSFRVDRVAAKYNINGRSAVQYINKLVDNGILPKELKAELQMENYTFKDFVEKINEVKQDKDIKDREGTQPAKYYAKDTEGDAMAKSTKKARARHFDKKKKGPAPGDASATTKPSKHTKKFKQMYGEQPEHEITVGNYTTKFFYMCGSAQKVMKKNANVEGAEELTRMQDDFYKLEKEVMDAGEATERQKEQAKDMYNQIMKKAGEVGLADDIDDYMKMHIDSIEKGDPKPGFGRTDLKEKLDKDADMGDYIKDFQKSDSPQFKGRSKEKRKDMAIAAYLDKNESLLNNVNKMLNEAGHADVVSMKNKVEIAQKALAKMHDELSKLGDEDSLPTWWTNKVATAVSKLDDMSDYLDTQVEGYQIENFKNFRSYTPTHISVPYGIYCGLLDYIGENYYNLNEETLVEDWWSDLTPAEQSEYIRDHPDSKKAKNAREKEDGDKDKKPSVKDKVKGLFSKEQTAGTLKDLKTHVDSVVKSVGVDAKVVAKAFKEPSVYNTVNALGGSLSAASKTIIGGARTVGKVLDVGGGVISDAESFKKLEKGVIKVDELIDKNPKLKKLAGAAVAGIATYQWLNMSFSGDIESDYDVSLIADGIAGKAGFADLINTPGGVKSMALLAAGIATGGGLPIWMSGKAGLSMALAYTGAKKMGDKESAKKIKEKMVAFGKKAKEKVQKGAKAVDKKLGVKSEGYQLDEKITALVNKAKKSGMPYGILKKVYDRGMAAYKTGHRPGATPQQWALARVNSFTTKSAGTWGKADKDLAKQVRGEGFDDDVDESLWANIHKKRKEGRPMRKKGEKGAPTAAQMKRAKGEEVDLGETNEWGEITEKSEYDGRPVDLNNPTKGDIKKYKVYVKNEKGNVVKVEFGDPNMEIKRDDPGRRKSFRARHNCDNPGPKYKARYWSCKFWSAKSVTDLMKG